jgi:hypothetical protein
LPTTVVMTPVAASMRRIRCTSVSNTKRLPWRSYASPNGWVMSAWVAGPPSPEKSMRPVPAMVLMTPVRA